MEEAPVSRPTENLWSTGTIEDIEGLRNWDLFLAEKTDNFYPSTLVSYDLVGSDDSSMDFSHLYGL